MGNKVVVIGSGFVGSTAAYTLLIQQVATEIVIVDINTAKAKAEALDIGHGVPLSGNINVRSGGYQDCAGADVIVITAGVAQAPGESRLDLLHRNQAIMNKIIDDIEQYNQDGVLLIVTNPVDVMTWVACQRSSRPSSKIIGSGTLLDSSRFRLIIGQEMGIDPTSVHASILGEHGDSQVPIWSSAQVGGLPIHFDEQTQLKVAELTRTAAYEIIQGKAATYYAVSLAIGRICSAILRDEQSVLEVSTQLQGEYDIQGVCLGVPCVLGSEGIQAILDFKLSASEATALKTSAAKMKEQIQLIEE